ncbi:MAG: class I SAM-dependent methyltransferase [Magnetococcus sp. WYHC-3]
MDNIHSAIKKKFGLNKRTDNLPYGAGRRYSRAHLAELFAELKFNVGAEVGVRRGRFSMLLCKCNPNLKLFCVDPWMAYSNKYTKERQEGIYQECLKNLAGYNVEIIRKTSIDALEDFKDRSLDFVFIDGNHQFDYVCPDIIYWAKKVKSGGIMSVHDYYAFGWSGVVQAVNSYTFCHDIRPWYVTKELEPTAFWVNP